MRLLAVARPSDVQLVLSRYSLVHTARAMHVFMTEDPAHGPQARRWAYFHRHTHSTCACPHASRCTGVHLLVRMHPHMHATRTCASERTRCTSSSRTQQYDCMHALLMLLTLYILPART